MVYDLGWTFTRRGELEVAEDLINKGKMLFEALNDSFGISLSLRNLGSIAHRRKKLDDALSLYRESLKVSESAKLDYSAQIRISIGNLLYRNFKVLTKTKK